MKKKEALILLSGPVDAIYRTVGTKKIILLSDKHETFAKCNGFHYNIDEYLENIFQQNIGIVDFFIEDNWTNIQTNGIPSRVDIGDYLSKLRKLSYQYYKKNDKRRIHFSDIRTEGSSLRELNEPLTKLVNNVRAIDKNYDFRDIFFDLHKRWIFILVEFTTMIKEYVKTNKNIEHALLQNVVLKKELVGLEKQIGKDNFTAIINIVQSEINSVLDIVFSDTKMTLDQFNYLSFHIIYPYTYIGELYSFARLMKPEFQNIIIYEGVAHIAILNKFLDVLHPKIDYQAELVSDNCIRVIPFEYYFSL